MKVKRAVLLGAVVVILGGSMAAWAVYNNQKHKNQATSSSSSQNAQQSHTNSQGKPLTVTGKMTCLKSRNNSGPHSAICAIGIVGDDGKNYALSAKDPTLTGSVPTGQQVKVTGLFTEKTTLYDMVGTIYVTSLERQ
jgi:lipopolysaccharide export LptBFGC system permease protein LptF